jgi:hypothetical protein
MWAYQAREIDSPIPCPYAKEFRLISQETIFARVTEMTTQEEFARCQQSLLSLYQDLAERMRKDTFHFPTARTGRHRCLDAEYEIAYHRLINLALFHEKQPEAPRQPLRTLDEVVRDLGDPFQPSPDETPLGIDDELPDIETPG